MSAQDWSVPIGGEQFTNGEWIEVRSPYDDDAPRPGARVRPGAGRRAPSRPRRQRARRGPLAAVEARRDPRHAPRACSRERVEEFARLIASEAAKPIKTARVEAQRAVSTFTFAAVAARTLAGDVVPMDASAAGEGKLAFTLRLPIGVVGAISPFNFPLNLVAHKLAPGDRGRLPGRAEAGEPDALSAIALARILLDECGLPAGHVATS